MADNLKIVDLKSHREDKENEYNKAWVKEMIEEFDSLKKSVEDGRLIQIVLQYEERVTEEELKEHPDLPHHTAVIHWNDDRDMDQTLGFASRLMFRLQMLAEGMLNQ